MFIAEIKGVNLATTRKTKTRMHAHQTKARIFECFSKSIINKKAREREKKEKEIDNNVKDLIVIIIMMIV